MQNQVVAAGSANLLFNSYSLLTSAAISDGLRQSYPQAQGRRVFSLTRSSFAGQQRTGAALWSGDISGSWDAMRRQISASLNYQMSGVCCSRCRAWWFYCNLQARQQGTRTGAWTPAASFVQLTSATPPLQNN